MTKKPSRPVAEGRRTTPLETELLARPDTLMLAMPALPNSEYRPTDVPCEPLIGNELAGKYGGWWE